MQGTNKLLQILASYSQRLRIHEQKQE